MRIFIWLVSEIKSRSVFYFHTVCLSSLFVIGQFIITLPFTKSPSSFLAFLLSAIAGGLLCFLVSLILSLKNKLINTMIFIMITVYSAFVLADTFEVFCGFARKVLFKDSFSVSVVLSFFLICSYFILSKNQNVLKFSLISFIYSAFVILIFIFLLLPNFKFSNISHWGNIEFNNMLDDFKQHFLNIFLSSILLQFNQVNNLYENKRNAVVLGVLLGSFILAVCGISTILLFGSGFTGVIEFPLVSVISTVSVGKLFSRLDAFCYFIFFFSCLLKIAVCGSVVISSLKNINKFQKNQLNS